MLKCISNRAGYFYPKQIRFNDSSGKSLIFSANSREKLEYIRQLKTKQFTIKANRELSRYKSMIGGFLLTLPPQMKEQKGQLYRLLSSRIRNMETAINCNDESRFNKLNDNYQKELTTLRTTYVNAKRDLGITPKSTKIIEALFFNILTSEEHQKIIGLQFHTEEMAIANKFRTELWKAYEKNQPITIDNHINKIEKIHNEFKDSLDQLRTDAIKNSDPKKLNEYTVKLKQYRLFMANIYLRDVVGQKLPKDVGKFFVFVLGRIGSEGPQKASPLSDIDFNIVLRTNGKYSNEKIKEVKDLVLAIFNDEKDAKLLQELCLDLEIDERFTIMTLNQILDKTSTTNGGQFYASIYNTVNVMIPDNTSQNIIFTEGTKGHNSVSVYQTWLGEGASKMSRRHPDFFKQKEEQFNITSGKATLDNWSYSLKYQMLRFKDYLESTYYVHKGIDREQINKLENFGLGMQTLIGGNGTVDENKKPLTTVFRSSDETNDAGDPEIIRYDRITAEKLESMMKYNKEYKELIINMMVDTGLITKEQMQGKSEREIGYMFFRKVEVFMFKQDAIIRSELKIPKQK